MVLIRCMTSVAENETQAKARSGITRTNKSTEAVNYMAGTIESLGMSRRRLRKEAKSSWNPACRSVRL